MTKFLYYALRLVQSDIYLLQKGSDQPHVYASDIQYIKVPAVPVSIQKKVLEILFSNAFFVIIKLWCLMLIKNQFHILNSALLRFLIRFVQLYSLQSAFLLKLHQFLLRHFLLNLKNCSI